MKKYIIAFLLLAAGILLLFRVGVVNDTKVDTTIVQSTADKDPLPQTEQDEEPDETIAISEEKAEPAERMAKADETQNNDTEENEAPSKPKRKLVGGAEVEWIETPNQDKRFGKFGRPPM